MSEKILSALDAITRVVMSYRPADKGLHLWSTWTGVDVTTLRREAEAS